MSEEGAEVWSVGNAPPACRPEHPTATRTASGNVILQRAAQDGVVPDTLVLTPADVKAISEAAKHLRPPAD